MKPLRQRRPIAVENGAIRVVDQRKDRVIKRCRRNFDLAAILKLSMDADDVAKDLELLRDQLANVGFAKS